MMMKTTTWKNKNKDENEKQGRKRKTGTTTKQSDEPKQVQQVERVEQVEQVDQKQPFQRLHQTQKFAKSLCNKKLRPLAEWADNPWGTALTGFRAKN